MVIRGLENYGAQTLARELALEHLDRVAQIFLQTGTVWENYAPDALQPGKPAKNDFVGWSGLGPILYFLEYAIGLKPDGPRQELTWELNSPRRHGCERFRFGGRVVSLLAEPQPETPGKYVLTIQSDGPFSLRLKHQAREGRFAIHPGEQKITF
jgi:hypothetical protein